MQTKFRLLKWILMVALSTATIGAVAQVGSLTNTGDMTVCLNTTQPYGVIPTPGSSYSWSIIGGSGGAGTIVTGPAPNNLISVIWTSAGTCTLQVIETSGACTGNPVDITVTVLPGLNPGTASGDQTICYNSIPEPITATEPVGGTGVYSYRWELSVDGGSVWIVVAGETSLTYAPGPLSQTTLYHLVQTSAGSCGTAITNNVTITVQPQVITSPIWHN
jgi:large repetitive protein